MGRPAFFFFHPLMVSHPPGVCLRTQPPLSVMCYSRLNPYFFNKDLLQERPYVDDDDTTVSSTVYEDDNSSYTEVILTTLGALMS